MASGPSKELIDSFMVYLPPYTSRDEAIKRLKGNNNSVEQAVNEYFEDPDDSSKKYRWDETQFSNDVDGWPTNHNISFDIHAPDDHGNGPFPQRFDGPGAPSRPPSRMGTNKSPLNKIIDLTGDSAIGHFNSSNDETEDLNRAIALSQQESGITNGTNQVHFGPAVRPQTEYEDGQWGMVPIGKSSVQEIYFDPDPNQRKREPDTPAFLKPSSKYERLGALLTIYHEIPLTRKLFMNPIDTELHFGWNKDWWSGEAIVMQELFPGEDPRRYPVERELQRYMAFLDGTERSYGSIDSLGDHTDVQAVMRNTYDRVEAAVLEVWRNANKITHPSFVRQIYSVGVESEKEEKDQEFAILELALPNKDSELETFYEMADEVLWPNLMPLESSMSPYLSKMAEVIAFRVEGGDESKTIDIPLVWYPDRYMKESKEAALAMRMKKSFVKEELDRIVKVEERLTYMPLRTGRIVKVKDLIQASLRHNEAEIKPEELESSDEMLLEPRLNGASAMLSMELNQVMASIDKKLEALNAEKDKARQTFRELSTLLTNPDMTTTRLHPYTLRGVSTTKNTMYVCRRAEEDLIDVSLEPDVVDSGETSNETSNAKDQWWRIHYANFGDNPVTVEKTTTEMVLEAARSESKNTLLVYASEAAMSGPGPTQLPKNLATFLKWDNAGFQQELRLFLESQNVSVLPPPYIAGPSSPGKRKRQSSSFFQDQNGTRVVEREARNSTSSDWSTQPFPTLDGQDEGVIMGIDPNLTMKDLPPTPMQEMQELGSLGGKPLGAKEMSKDDAVSVGGMDLDQKDDQVLEDEVKAEPSAAVNRVEFAD